MLRPLTDRDLELVASWMAQKENYQWLDFGDGRQILSALALKFMMQRQTHCLRLFTGSAGEPIGLVSLSSINRAFKTGALWYVLGNKRYGGRGCTTRAASELLTVGFHELGLWAVNAWAVADNIPSVRVLEHNHFSLVGRQRQCHYVEGRACDRLLFDLLACEHQGA